ncbi:DNA polymerase III, delta subunit [Candidatus Electrothrix aarhusensis]|uniref:DNA polymerase III, delta subunit n=1 Tax=Candidatus Electrothrix aarhusensis TaxID=1859131 RepID=A0A444J085_9BACT|nr:DNA polymerase III, delta subunit [Candidatus Electrothrix aarhusensis]
MPFSSIIGQLKAVNLLTRALNGNRLAHGYLFVGPEGVGKTTTARAWQPTFFVRQRKHVLPAAIAAAV